MIKSCNNMTLSKRGNPRVPPGTPPYSRYHGVRQDILGSPGWPRASGRTLEYYTLSLYLSLYIYIHIYIYIYVIYIHTLYLVINVGPQALKISNYFSICFKFFQSLTPRDPNNSKSTGRDLHFYKTASKSDGILMIS